MQVSAYSLKSLTQACRPLMASGGSVVGLTFDATVAWPAYDWMGVAKAGLESTSRYLARDLGPDGIRVNLVSAGPLRTLAAKAIPGFERPRGHVDRPGRRSAGTTPTTSRPPRRSARCCPTSSRRPPARSCTSTAASTRWAPDREFDSVPGVADEPASLVELRVLEGPNLYFPRAAIKLTLDIGGLAAVPEETAQRFAQRIGLRNARPGKPDTGFRQRFALRAVARLVRAIANESGSTRLAVRVRPDQRPAPDRRGLPVAAPRPCAGDGHGGRGGARRGARRRRWTRW